MKIMGRPAPPAMAVTTLLMSLSFSQPAIAANLGVANDYNVFVFNDYKQIPNSSDVWGRLAVGGNATAPGGVNLVSKLPSSPQLAGPNPPALVVGGDLQLSAQVLGDALVGGQVSKAANPGTGTITGSLTLSSSGGVSGVNVDGGVINDPAPGGLKVTLSNFFDSAYGYLSDLSSSLSSRPTNGTQVSNGDLTLTGTQADLNIFNITGDQLTDLASTGRLIINAPMSSTVLVNVDGSFHLQNSSVLLNDIGREDVLFNLFNASTAQITGFSFQGSLLAPNTDILANNGNFEGTLVANSFEGTLEAHNYQFQGNVPGGTNPSAAVPTPALLPGLLGFAAAMRKRYKQAVA